MASKNIHCFNGKVDGFNMFHKKRLQVTGIQDPAKFSHMKSMLVLTYLRARTAKPNFLIGQWPNELSVFIGHF